MVDRKQEVKQARETYKKEGFFNYFIIPLITYWKDTPVKAITTFVSYTMLFYIGFTAAQAINNDMIYCDSSVDRFDGKLMFSYNPYVNWVNNNSVDVNTEDLGKYTLVEINDDFNIEDLDKSTLMEIGNEAQTSSIYCNYNLTKWFSEPLASRLHTTLKGWYIIALKR